MAKERSKHRKIVLLASSRLNIIVKILSEALTHAGIIHQSFTLVSNEAESYRRLKENIGIKNSQRSKVSSVNILNTMLSYCEKCKTDTGSKNPKLLIVKYQDLSKNRKQVGY